MSLFAEVRAAIPDADSRKSPAEIIAALPQYDAQAIRESVGYQYRHGILDRTGNKSDGYRYFVRRQLMVNQYDTPEEAEQARREREKLRHTARRRAKNAMPRQKYLAQMAARSAATKQRKAAEREALRRERAQKREDEREATRQAVLARKAAAAARRDAERRQAAEKRAQRVLTKQQRIAAHAAPKAAHTAPKLAAAVAEDRKAAKAQPQRVETVDEWMARTGQKPEVLPACSMPPLTYTGHRAVNEASWRDREYALGEAA